MQQGTSARVLLVDDEVDYVEVLGTRLTSRGMKVRTATSGEQALDMVESQVFDLIILDLAMPGMDGLETLKGIKQKQPEAEIIMLSGQATIKTSIEAMKLGAEDFLVKPVDISELTTKINQAQDRRLSLLESKSIQEIEKIINSKGW